MASFSVLYRRFKKLVFFLIIFYLVRSYFLRKKRGDAGGKRVEGTPERKRITDGSEQKSEIKSKTSKKDDESDDESESENEDEKIKEINNENEKPSTLLETTETTIETAVEEESKKDENENMERDISLSLIENIKPPKDNNSLDIEKTEIVNEIIKDNEMEMEIEAKSREVPVVNNIEIIPTISDDILNLQLAEKNSKIVENVQSEPVVEETTKKENLIVEEAKQKQELHEMREIINEIKENTNGPEVKPHQEKVLINMVEGAIEEPEKLAAIVEDIIISTPKLKNEVIENPDKLDIVVHDSSEALEETSVVISEISEEIIESPVDEVIEEIPEPDFNVAENFEEKQEIIPKDVATLTNAEEIVKPIVEQIVNNALETVAKAQTTSEEVVIENAEAAEAVPETVVEPETVTQPEVVETAPVVAEPEVAQPEAVETAPVVAEPEVAAQPETVETAPVEPEVAQPEAVEAAPVESEVTQPEAVEAAPVEPEVTQPETVEVAPVEPEVAQPETVETAPVEPEVAQPEAVVEPEVTQPEAVEAAPVEPEVAAQSEVVEAAPVEPEVAQPEVVETAPVVVEPEVAAEPEVVEAAPVVAEPEVAQPEAIEATPVVAEPKAAQPEEVIENVVEDATEPQNTSMISEEIIELPATEEGKSSEDQKSQNIEYLISEIEKVVNDSESDDSFIEEKKPEEKEVVKPKPVNAADIVGHEEIIYEGDADDDGEWIDEDDDGEWIDEDEEEEEEEEVEDKKEKEKKVEEIKQEINKRQSLLLNTSIPVDILNSLMTPKSRNSVALPLPTPAPVDNKPRVLPDNILERIFREVDPQTMWVLRNTSIKTRNIVDNILKETFDQFDLSMDPLYFDVTSKDNLGLVLNSLDLSPFALAMLLHEILKLDSQHIGYAFGQMFRVPSKIDIDYLTDLIVDTLNILKTKKDVDIAAVMHGFQHYYCFNHSELEFYQLFDLIEMTPEEVARFIQNHYHFILSKSLPSLLQALDADEVFVAEMCKSYANGDMDAFARIISKVPVRYVRTSIHPGDVQGDRVVVVNENGEDVIVVLNDDEHGHGHSSSGRGKAPAMDDNEEDWVEDDEDDEDIEEEEISDDEEDEGNNSRDDMIIVENNQSFSLFVGRVLRFLNMTTKDVASFLKYLPEYCSYDEDEILEGLNWTEDQIDEMRRIMKEEQDKIARKMRELSKLIIQRRMSISSGLGSPLSGSPLSGNPMSSFSKNKI